MRGAGRATVPMFVMLACWCVIRVTYITVAVKIHPVIQTVFWAYPLTWTLSSILFLIFYLKSDWIHGFEKKKRIRTAIAESALESVAGLLSWQQVIAEGVIRSDERTEYRTCKQNFSEIKKIFDDISYGIHDGDKIGIIGINGTGKSTLLKIIAGEEETDEGQVITQNGLRITYLPQMPDFPKGAIVQDYVADGKWQKDWSTQSEARNILNKLGITEHDALVEQLSGGQKKKVALARTLVNPSDVLILDEPTNHLDIASREWIEEAVEAYDGTLLFVSHDRYFINRFATRIWEVANGTITDYPMGFAQYRQVKAQEEAEKNRSTKACKRKRWLQKNRFAATGRSRRPGGS